MDTRRELPGGQGPEEPAGDPLAETRHLYLREKSDLEGYLLEYPDDSCRRMTYANMLHALGDVPGAIRELREAYRNDPPSASFYGILAAWTRDLGRYNEAAVHYERAMEIAFAEGDFRSVAVGYWGLAELFQLHGEFEDAKAYTAMAISALERAVATGEGSPALLAQIREKYAQM